MADRKPRGELAELSSSLQALCTGGKRSDAELQLAKREVFRKCINYMTLGMDMASLFPIMTSCANLSPNDIVLKKMLYLYITHYASAAPDLALLAINQLHKDCNDQDPTVRGLALRSLCSLRVPNFLEYVLAPINTGLEDRHPYVRKTAIMGVLKLYHLDPTVVASQGMLERICLMLYQDTDPSVMGNALSVMLQTDDVERLANDKKLLFHLINHLKELSDWSQCQVLDLASRFHPAGEAETFDLLNALEDRLQHTNSAVVMGAIKVFLHLTLSMPATHQQVLERIKDPLKTLISRDDPATAYAALSHLLLLVQRAPFIFETDYVSFYCRTHDPLYIKRLKMELLAAIASSSNVYEVVSELTEYARDVHPGMAREAVRAVGRIALAVPDVHGIVERLLVFLESGYEHIMAETLIQMKDLLRRYPDLSSVSTVTMNDLKPSDISEPEAKAALVWIMGQFGENMPSAPYALEPLAETFMSEPVPVRLALLTAAIKLFFKRPPECQRLLGQLLAAGLQDSHQDVHDRALLYNRLLRQDVQETERVVCGRGLAPGDGLRYFSEDLDPEVRERIFQEFNSLSVVYQMPANMFVENTPYQSAASETGSPHAGQAASNGDASVYDAGSTLLASSAVADLLDLDGPGPSPPVAADATAGAATGLEVPDPMAGGAGGAGLGSLLDLDMALLGPSAAAPEPPGVVLSSSVKIPPGVFQEKWRSLPPASQYTEALSPATVAALAANNHRDFCQHMAQAYIIAMASGGQPPTYRYYFYATEADSGALFLVEMLVAVDSCTASITLKTEAPAQQAQFLDLWGNCLLGFGR